MSSRSKKTRKVGQIGVRKDPDRKPRTTVQQGKKKGKGKPSGTRNAQEQDSTNHSQRKQVNDPRHGSKKPVALVKEASVPTYATPAEELAAIEADSKLMLLLDKADEGQTMTKAEQRFMDEKMARHRTLCELLGIDPEADEEADDDHDPLDDLDAIKMDDFKK
ncbi:GTPase-activating protein [Salinimonas marina]|uniref:GTPase-activating protein n=1 Tax=Salinimonas marina TaxID=2785918 RepID=A0A7S9HDL7_9ALTE|nr:Der GTPase-activating protein YihI [Salinimonas marina]QPG05686.1 GTPase-activating protein [Salinimonas marina]